MWMVWMVRMTRILPQVHNFFYTPRDKAKVAGL